jgi:glutamate-1-semialdehyde 2,1-aminomutase
MDIFTPNMVVYGKAISNGYPFACVLGDKVMRCFEDTFISSTYWTESISMAAALATIRSLNKQSYCDRNAKQAIIGRALVEKHGAELSGIPGLMHYTFPDMTRQEWCERMLERGYLVTDNLYLSFAHTLTDIHEFTGAI